MHTVFALLCFVVVIHWLIFPYPSGLLHWHCGNLTIAPVPAKQPWIMDKYFMWIHYERLHNHNKAKHNKTVCIFLGIYCSTTFHVLRICVQIHLSMKNDNIIYTYIYYTYINSRITSMPNGITDYQCGSWCSYALIGVDCFDLNLFLINKWKTC